MVAFSALFLVRGKRCTLWNSKAILSGVVRHAVNKSSGKPLTLGRTCSAPQAAKCICRLAYVAGCVSITDGF